MIKSKLVWFTCWNSAQIVDTWEQYLCAVPGKSMVCQGDSGGPMVCNNKLYGVCSFFINWKGEPHECGGKHMQTVHVFIRYFKPWIDAIVPKEKKAKNKSKSKKKSKKKKKSSGKSIIPHHTFHVVIAVLWYNELSFYWDFKNL